jgi:hypothetical protein
MDFLLTTELSLCRCCFILSAIPNNWMLKNMHFSKPIDYASLNFYYAGKERWKMSLAVLTILWISVREYLLSTSSILSED